MFSASAGTRKGRPAGKRDLMIPAVKDSPSRETFFDKRAEAYDREYGHQTAGGYALRIRREKVLRMFDQPGGKVLDVGCGPAVMAQEILDRGCGFWGVDPAIKMLDICRRRLADQPRAQFLQGDAAGLAFPNEFFDAVLCMGVIDGVPDRRLALREMLRVLRPGGTLIITFTNLYSPYSWWKRFVFYPAVAAYQRIRPSGSTPRQKSAPRAKERSLYSKSSAFALVESEGARVIHAEGYYFNVWLSPLDEIFPAAALRVTTALEEHRYPRPEWLAGGWIIKAHKIGGAP